MRMTTITINNRKLLNSILDYCSIDKIKQETVILSLDKLQKFGITIVEKELKNKGIKQEQIDNIKDIFNIKEKNKNLLRVYLKYQKKYASPPPNSSRGQSGLSLSAFYWVQRLGGFAPPDLIL